MCLYSACMNFEVFISSANIWLFLWPNFCYCVLGLNSHFTFYILKILTIFIGHVLGKFSRKISSCYVLTLENVFDHCTVLLGANMVPSQFSSSRTLFLLFIFLFLAFDFCLFCVVIRGIHPRHNGQLPPTSKDFLSQILSITFIFLS